MVSQDFVEYNPIQGKELYKTTIRCRGNFRDIHNGMEEELILKLNKPGDLPA